MNVYVIDDNDYFVAADLDHLWALFEAFFGSTYEDMVGEPRSGAYIIELPPETKVTVNDEGANDEEAKTLTAAEWAKGGAGFLCSSEC